MKRHLLCQSPRLALERACATVNSRLGVAGLAAVLAVAGCPQLVRPAQAQAIVASVNGDPITSIDVEQRMKLLRALHKPATRDAAIESMVSDRLKERETSRFSVSIKDDEVGEELQIIAKKMKVSTTQLSADIARNGVSQRHATNYLKAELGYAVLIKALNKGVEASEVAVRQELAKEKGKGGGITTYTLRQVVFTLNPGDTAAAVNASAKEAEALRSRFTSCQTGIPYAKTLPGVAVREKLVRSSTQLGDQIKEELDKMPVGHLTPPSRSPNGVELIALCDRTSAGNDDELRKNISDRLLGEHMDATTQVKYREMRAAAVIEKH